MDCYSGRYKSFNPNKICQLGIVLNDPENSLTIPARMDMNNTIVVRHADDRYGSALSYDGSLTVLGQCVACVIVCVL